MTEQEAKMLAAELDQHRYWQVHNVGFNPNPPAKRVSWVNGVLVTEWHLPGWEVHLKHRYWPECGEEFIFHELPEYPTETVTALIESGKRLERWHQELATARIAR